MTTGPLLFLTSHVSTIFSPVQATKKIWHQELSISITARGQAAEGLVKIQFAEERMSLLDELRLGEFVTVGFLVRGVDSYWDGATKYLVVLLGQQVVRTPEPGGQRSAPGVPTADFSDAPTPVPLPRSREFGAEPTF